MLALKPAHPCSFHIKLFTLDPMGMLWKMSKGQHRASWSPNLEESQLSVTGLVEDNLHFVVLSQVSLLSRVCSSRVVAVHPAHSACMTIQRGVLSTGLLRKSWFQWRTHQCPVHWFFMMFEGLPSVTPHTTSYGSLSHQSFTFLFPLETLALARKRSPGSCKMALVFL